MGPAPPARPRGPSPSPSVTHRTATGQEGKVSVKTWEMMPSLYLNKQTLTSYEKMAAPQSLQIF